MADLIKNKFSSINANVAELIKKGSIAFIYRILNMTAAYFLLYIISRHYGRDGMGVYTLMIAYISILGVVGALGMNTAIIRFTSQYKSKNKTVLAGTLYKSTLKFTIPFSILLAVILLLFSKFVAVKLYEDADLILPFRIISFTLPFMVLLLINVEFIRGLKNIKISELFRNLSTNLITLVLILITIRFLSDNYYLILFYGIGVIISSLATSISVFGKIKNLRHITIEKSESVSLKSYFLISLPMILTSVMMIINGRIATITLGLFYTTGLIGIFGAAFRISVITDFVISALKTIAMPKISELFWNNETQELKHLIQVSTRIIFFTSFPITIILLLFPGPILSVLGKEFVQGADVLRILAIGQFISASSGLVGAFLNMTGNHVVFTKLALVSVVIAVILCFTLIPPYSITGAAIATVGGMLIWNIGGAWFIYNKYKIKTFYFPSIKRSKIKNNKI